MGFDVSGRKPTAEVGKYFRNNVWWWHDLWEYCVQVAPAICAKVKHAHTNDGDGLRGKKDCQDLAELLRKEVTAGRTAEFALRLKAERDALPDEKCPLCEGTGKRDDVYVKGTCNGCEGKGTRRPSATWYQFDATNVAQFADFLEHCGGFKIH